MENKMDRSFVYQIPVECWLDDNSNAVYVDADGNTVRFPVVLANMVDPYLVDKETHEIIISLRVDWWYTPGSYLDPPEGGEERNVIDITIESCRFGVATSSRLEELFEYIIEEYEFPQECYD
jgi:hypothetical protein